MADFENQVMKDNIDAILSLDMEVLKNISNNDG